MSRRCGPMEQVRVVSVFARRPKIEFPGQNDLAVKFNASLFRYACFAAKAGILTFAGVPVVTSIFDLTIDADCRFFELHGNVAEEDVIVQVDRRGPVSISPQHANAVSAVMGPTDFVEKVMSKTKPRPWFQVIETLQELRRADPHHGHPFFGSSYHPFNILLLN